MALHYTDKSYKIVENFDKKRKIGKYKDLSLQII